MSSPYIYVNAPLPRQFTPPQITKVRQVTDDELTVLLKSNDVRLTPKTQGRIEERILDIFQQDEILFGDPAFIPANRLGWLEKIRYFTDKHQVIEFVAMAFPYKIPNPLKTQRHAPDAGEALMLRRFQILLDAIAMIYPPGGRLTLLEEGILGRCQGVEPQRIANYRRGIARIAAIANIDPDRICFHSLDDMVTKIPNFEARWIHEQERLRELWQQGDPAMCTAYQTTVAAQRTSIPTFDYDPSMLVEAYNPDKTESALRYVRDYIDKVAHRQFFAYRALLALRDTSGYLHELRPHALKLTVSPKPENLSVLPVNRWSRILPYHGVAVLGNEEKWHIAYYAAMGADFGDVEALNLTGDFDPAPIAYRIAS